MHCRKKHPKEKGTPALLISIVVKANPLSTGEAQSSTSPLHCIYRREKIYSFVPEKLSDHYSSRTRLLWRRYVASSQVYLFAGPELWWWCDLRWQPTWDLTMWPAAYTAARSMRQHNILQAISTYLYILEKGTLTGIPKEAPEEFFF